MLFISVIQRKHSCRCVASQAGDVLTLILILSRHVGGCALQRVRPVECGESVSPGVPGVSWYIWSGCQPGWLAAQVVTEGFWSTGSLIPFNRSMQWNVAVMQALQTLAKRPLFLISCTRIYCSFPGWTSQHINLLGTQPFYRWMQPRNLQYCQFFSSTFVNTRHEFEPRPSHCPVQLYYVRVILIDKSLKF